MSITYVYPGDRPWDCASQMGPCEDCRPIIDSSVNPRHLPAVQYNLVATKRSIALCERRTELRDGGYNRYPVLIKFAYA